LTRALRLKGIQAFRAPEWGLHPIHLDTWGPWVFLNFGGQQAGSEGLQGSVEEWLGVWFGGGLRGCVAVWAAWWGRGPVPGGMDCCWVLVAARGDAVTEGLATDTRPHKKRSGPEGFKSFVEVSQMSYSIYHVHVHEKLGHVCAPEQLLDTRRREACRPWSSTGAGGRRLVDLGMHDALVHVARREYTLECNWKVFADNYLVGGRE